MGYSNSSTIEKALLSEFRLVWVPTVVNKVGGYGKKRNHGRLGRTST